MPNTAENFTPIRGRPRLELTDTSTDCVMKMAEGNPGAITALMEILTQHNAIDPQAAMGGMGAILILDTWEIYGSSIYVLWSDKCGKDVRKLLMLMRATQLGFFSQTKLQEMAADQGFKVNLSDEEFTELDEKVCNALEDFKKPEGV